MRSGACVIPRPNLPHQTYVPSVGATLRSINCGSVDCFGCTDACRRRSGHFFRGGQLTKNSWHIWFKMADGGNKRVAPRSRRIRSCQGQSGSEKVVVAEIRYR